MKEGWEYKKLGDLALSMADGPFGSNLKKEHYTNRKEVRIIQLSNIGEEGWRDENTKYTTYEHLDSIKRSEVLPGDVVIAKMMPAGRAILCPNKESKYVLSSDAVRVTLKKGLNSRFILFSINSPYFRKQVYDNVSGSGRVRTSLTKLRDCKVGLPPLSEQQSIVDYLDSAFAKIDAMKANAEKALNEAKALFQASLKEMLEPKEGWEEKTLKDVSVIHGNYGLSVPSTEFNGVRYLRITDITEWGDLNDEKVSAKLDEEKEQELLEEGDILFARTGATVGKTLLYKEAFGKCFFAGYLIRYRLKKEMILPKFLFYITHSDNYYKWVLENQKAAAQPNISAKLYNEYLVLYPPLSEQQSIVETLDSLKSKVDRLQANYDKISQECDALKQAILRQVFE